jgi:hypothetical protein
MGKGAVPTRSDLLAEAFLQDWDELIHLLFTGAI